MGQIPYGYRIENGAAVIIPAEAAQIRLIFQNYIAGMSLQSAARAAGHPMAHSTVRRMLQRKCYLGDAFYPAILDKETYARANAAENTRIRWKHAISTSRISLSFDSKQGVMQQCQKSLQFHPESKEIML